MSILEVLFLGAALSMDAFAVSVCKGLCLRKPTAAQCALAGIWFGSFQALMPAAGYLLGSALTEYIGRFVPWIALVLLGAIGGNMIKEAFGDGEDSSGASMAPKVMLPLAVATSIDALAAGLTLALLKVNVFASCLMIGLTTFTFSFFGVKLGAVFGNRYEKGSRIAGGAILILIGIKIFLEHMGWL
ncbi:MAG: manganese efflux pump [Eubacteriaceae bacterium]|nr:manganese efflux pump [Eubacteriaceae bacterium]